MRRNKLSIKLRELNANDFRIILCVLVIHFSSFLSLAQSQDVRHFDYNNGMPGSEVYGSYLDKNGFIWFFGDAGLSKYNGYTFKQFSISNGLPDNTIFELVEDKKGRIWTRTFSGKIAYILNDSVIELPCNTYLTEMISGNAVVSLVCDNNDIVWLGLSQSSGLIQISPPYKKENVKVLNYDFSGRYVVSIEKDFIYGNGPKPLTEPLKLFLSKNEKINIAFEHQTTPNREIRFLKLANNKWLIGFDNTVLLIGNNKLIKQITVPGYLVSLSYAKHKYWIGLFRGGSIQLDENFENITQNDLLKDNTISKVTEDKEGGLWITTIEKGTFYYPDDRITVYKSKDGLAEQELSCSFKNDNLFIVAGKTGKLYKYEHSIFNEVNPLKIKKENSMTYNCFSPLLNNSLIACGSFPFIINFDKSSINYLPVKTGNLKKAKYLPKEKIVLFTNTHALHFADATTGDVLYSCLAPQRIHSIEAIDTNTIYLGLASGFYKYHQGKISQVVFKDHTINERVTAIALKNNWIIVGTNGYGIKANNGTQTFIYNEKNGLISNIVTCMILIDNQLIVGTNKGLQQFRVSDGIKNGNQIDISNGLPSNEIKYLNYFNDTLYITTSTGLVRLPLSLFSEETLVPEFNELNVWAGNELLNDEKENSISSGKNKILVNYNVAYYKSSGKQLFRYKLSDSDSGWIYTSGNSVYFNSMPKGNYQLMIQYFHKNKGWISSDKHYKFKIEGYFWETWWFILSCILLGMLITFLVVSNYYTKRILKTKLEGDLAKRMANIEMKALRSQMNPHFIFNVLNSIQNYILKQDAINAHRLLGRFAKLIRNILEQAVHDTITVEHEIETLKLYVELECMRMNEGFEYKFEIETSELNERIPSMLIQPFIENAIRHGLANKEADRKLFILIKGYEKHVKFIIKDNGVGRTESVKIKTNSGIKRESLGMQITNERIELVKQVYHKEINVEILDHVSDDDISLGTEIIISIPYITN